MKCRLCNAELKHVFVDLGHSPAANSFLSNLDEPETWYPLKVMVCHECFLVQMDEYKLATEIFNEDYPYYSSHSPNNVSRAKEYAEMMMKRFKLDEKSRVLEIGCNDGYLLQWFVGKVAAIRGYEPARKAAILAREKGARTHGYGRDDRIKIDTNFFGVKTCKAHGKFDLICGSNVLAHNPNLNDFVEGLRIALKPDGVITMEFPTVVNLLNGSCQFDTIYHEHFNYLSFTVVCDLFKRHGLEVFDVQHTPEQGGSIMVFARHQGPGLPMPTVRDLLEAEKSFGITKIERYEDFQDRVERTKHNLLSYLLIRKQNNESVIAYGASCKCNTLLNYCGIKSDLIKYVVDKSPLKQGKFLPGSHLPIYSEEVIKRDRPDYVIITAWNLKDEIMEQLAYIREWGGKFIMTTPYLEVL